jgi:hypothetical protein
VPTRAAFGLVAVLAAASGSPSATRAEAASDAQTVYNPFGADTTERHSYPGSASAVWGWPYAPHTPK